MASNCHGACASNYFTQLETVAGNVRYVLDKDPNVSADVREVLSRESSFLDECRGKAEACATCSAKLSDLRP